MDKEEGGGRGRREPDPPNPAISGELEVGAGAGELSHVGTGGSDPCSSSCHQRARPEADPRTGGRVPASAAGACCRRASRRRRPEPAAGACPGGGGLSPQPARFTAAQGGVAVQVGFAGGEVRASRGAREGRVRREVRATLGIRVSREGDARGF